ncbi:MAG: isoprenyl transferase [Bacteroidia bacterium]|nr:isoprenyl transferase [Bacteroidia bacterium]
MQSGVVVPAGIDPKRIPNHVAIIMDGNGRWAKQKGNQRIFGHRSAIAAVRDTVEGAASVGIGHLTLYAFSTENWGRPKLEVDALMKLLVATIRKETDTLQKNGIRLNAIGNLADLPATTRREVAEAMAATAINTRMTLTLALSYGSRNDLVQAVQKLAHRVASGQLHPEDITETLVAQQLSTWGIPDPELLIRTSGELRISNFLLWESAYTEFVVLDKFWPDFRREDLFEALRQYQSRERRFGKISEQIQAS